MARDDPHFRLRLPQRLKERIEADAAASGRSINAEIVARLSGNAALGLGESDLHDLLGVIDGTLAALGSLARDKTNATALDAAGAFSSAYQLGSWRRIVLAVLWRREYERDATIRHEYVSSDAYLTAKYAELDAAIMRHGMSAGRGQPEAANEAPSAETPRRRPRQPQK